MNALKKIFVFIASFFMFFLLYGCTNRSAEEKTLEVNILKNAKMLHMDTLSVHGIDLSTARQFYVYADSVLIVENNPHDGNWLIELYNLNTGNLFRKLFRIGRGHGEVLLSNVRLSGTQLIVYDFQQQKSCSINMDTLLFQKQYEPQFVKHSESNAFSVAFLKGKPIMENSFVFEDENLDIHQKDQRILYCTTTKELKKQYKYDTQNVAGSGLIIVKPDNKKVVYASCHQSFLEVYDKDLNLMKAVKGPILQDINYYIDENNEIIFNKSIPYAYTNYYCTQKEIGLIYYGAMVDANNDHLQNHKAFLLQFDWDGILKQTIALGGYARTISQSKMFKNTYYVCFLGANNELYLCKIHE